MSVRNIGVVILGILLGLVGPISLVFFHFYFFGFLGPLDLYGGVLAEWIWFLIIGVLVGLISNPRKFYLVFL